MAILCGLSFSLQTKDWLEIRDPDCLEVLAVYTCYKRKTNPGGLAKEYLIYF